jgi:hypothetical protein
MGIIFLLCLCSCVSGSAARENQLYVWLTNNSKYILLPPANIEKPMDMPQLLSASYSGQDYFLNAWVKADETGMDMTLLNELGVNMGELSWRNGVVSFSSPIAFPKSLRPEYIIADFQLCFYNTHALSQALKDCGLLFEEAGISRRISQGSNVIIEIERGRNTVKLVNHLRGYTYTLEGDFK